MQPPERSRANSGAPLSAGDGREVVSLTPRPTRAAPPSPIKGQGR